MKSIRRERKRDRNKRKQVQHGVGKWKPIDGISKTRKRILEDKLRIN